MKKIFVYIAAVSIVAACAKEVPFSDERPSNNPGPGTEMILHASIPQMTNASKADAIGTFSWDDGDAIAIPVDGGYVDFIYDSAQDAFTYTVTGSETFVDGTAYYPSTSIPGGSYTTEFGSPDAARAGFKMEASYTVGSTDINFTHKSSLLKLSFDNVPSTATSVRVKEGDSVIATIALSSPTSNLDVYIPITPNGSQTYYFALMQGTIVLKEVKKNSATLTAGTYYTSKSVDYSISELYLIGAATEAGWTIPNMPALAKDGDIFSIYANLTANEKFRFPMQKISDVWWPGLVKGDTDGTVKIGDSDANEEDQFKVNSDGFYHISIDVSSMTIDITRIGDKIENLYLLGNGSDAGWVLANEIQFTNANNVYSATANLYAGGEFRLQTQNSDWWPGIVKNKTTGELKYCASQTEWDSHATEWSAFTVDQSGSYEIVLDANTWIVTITRKGHIVPANTITELYLIGNASEEAGWTINNAVPFNKTGNVFTLTTNLYPDGIFRMLTQKVTDQWWPSIVKDKSDGGPMYCASQTDWDARNTMWDHYSITQEGSYDIVFDADTWTLTITRKGDVVLPAISIDHLYLLGDATDIGWGITDMPEFTKTGTVFTLTTHLNNTGICRFLTQKTDGVWYPAIVKHRAQGRVKLANDATNDEHFTVPVDGEYLITVDVADCTYSIVLLDADAWYIIGDVYDDDSTVGAWSRDFAMTETEPGKWSITIHINGEFKLRKYNSYTTNQWSWNLGLWSTGQLGTSINYGLLRNGENIGIETPGLYSLQLEPNNTNVSNLLTGSKID